MSPPFRIHVPVYVPLASDGVNALAPTLWRRQNGEDSGRGGPKPGHIAVFVVAAIAGTIIIILILRYLYRRRRRATHTYQPAEPDDDSPTTRQINRQNQENLDDALTEAQARNGSNNGQTRSTTDAGVDRTTSVRSVMTLPVYRPKATENEQVLGREGERDGIDVVVEMPSAEQEEALRDEEMEALYQIRAARRRQIADREERQRLRREARQANDVVALRELRERARNRATQNAAEIEELRHEHDRIRETRQRVVSSVSYADVGIARADGTRIRANSTDSNERVGLLSDAASIAADSNSLFHRRDRSASASLSIDTSRSLHDRPESPALTIGGSPYALGRPRSRANSAATTTPRILSATTTPRAGSSPEIIDAEEDLGDAGFPPPPGYDEVSLDDITPMHSRRGSVVSAVSGGRTSPYPEPPPDYPGPSPVPSPGLPGGPGQARNSRLSAHMEDLAAQVQTEREGEGEGQGEGSQGVARLPSLRLRQVPQIVIEPSSARP
ncbi:hypothetical protein MFIFM68171_00791 [Madurella fahalii]|uniref:Uncharacterized protein n=1 Tax=Madurella fahalii TaxID=1157608 RepID=A0ABQ0FYI7_9PEZI